MQNEQEDISQIVDQVLSCIDAEEGQTNPFEDDFASYRDGLETLLCHNCGALMRTKAEMCRQCGTDVTTGQQQASSSLPPDNEAAQASTTQR